MYCQQPTAPLPVLLYTTWGRISPRLGTTHNSSCSTLARPASTPCNFVCIASNPLVSCSSFSLLAMSAFEIAKLLSTLSLKVGSGASGSSDVPELADEEEEGGRLERSERRSSSVKLEVDLPLPFTPSWLCTGLDMSQPIQGRESLQSTASASCKKLAAQIERT